MFTKTTDHIAILRPMQARIITANELSGSDIVAWRQLRKSLPIYDNPFYAPEFTQIMALLRPDVRVAVIEQDGRPVAFLPYHTSITGVAHALGVPVSNAQGPVFDVDCGLTLQRIMQISGLKGYRFTNLPPMPGTDMLTCHQTHINYELDISSGGAAYLAGQRARHPKHFKKTDYYHRLACRKYGTVEVIMNDTSQGARDALFRLKYEQYERTRSVNILKSRWVRGLYDHLVHSDNVEFMGVVSSLRLGGNIAAVQLDVQSRSYGFTWLTAYDRAYSDVSPGNILSVETAVKAAEVGVGAVDWGIDYGYYKEQFCNRTSPMYTGYVAGCGLGSRILAACAHQEIALSDEHASKPAQIAGKVIHRLNYIAACEPTLAGRAASILDSAVSRFRSRS